MIDYSDMILEVAAEQLSSLSQLDEADEGGVLLRSFSVSTKRQAKECGRKVGEYHCYEGEGGAAVSAAIATTLAGYIPRQGNVLIIALGNPRYIADKLGTATLDRITLRDNVYKLYPLCEALTNISSFDLVMHAVKIANPSLVIAIDTLATRTPSRIAKSIQLTTAGITPGGGVGNAQPAINEGSIKVKTIAIGTPLIVSSRMIEPGGTHQPMTAANIDELIIKSAEIIASGINMAIK